MLESQGSLLTESTIIMDKHSINQKRIRRVLDARDKALELCEVSTLIIALDWLMVV